MKTRCLMTIALVALLISGAQGSTKPTLMGSSQIDNTATTQYSCVISNLDVNSINVTISIYGGNGTLISSGSSTVASHTSFGLFTASQGFTGAFCLATATDVANLRGYFQAFDTSGNILGVRDLH